MTHQFQLSGLVHEITQWSNGDRSVVIECRDDTAADESRLAFIPVRLPLQFTDARLGIRTGDHLRVVGPLTSESADLDSVVAVFTETVEGFTPPHAEGTQTMRPTLVGRRVEVLPREMYEVPDMH
jgi:hypothetical protein